MSSAFVDGLTAHSRPIGPNVKVTQLRVIRSEWTKFRSLRSTVATLAIAVIAMIGLGALSSGTAARDFHTYSAADRAGFDAIGTSLSGVLLAQMAVGVLGVLLISGEYSTGAIRSTMTAVPRRLPVLWGKLIVFAVTVFAVSLISSLLSFVAGQALLHGVHADVDITAPGVARSVIGAAAYLTVSGMVGLALGALTRNTAAGISAFVGAFYLLPLLTAMLPSSVSSHVTPYLPSNAGAAVYGTGHDVRNSLSPSVGLAVLCVEVAILTGMAAYRLRRVDA